MDDCGGLGTTGAAMPLAVDGSAAAGAPGAGGSTAATGATGGGGVDATRGAGGAPTGAGTVGMVALLDG